MTIRAGTRRAVLAGAVGNVLEWYDFAVYGFFAREIGVHFFPSDDPRVSVVAAFGVFAIGFLARPLGACLFGHLGDVLGRRRVLMLSIMMMAVPTFLVGVVPTYATLGVMAPVLLVLLRLAQGASVGGELTGSVTYMVEAAQARRRGLAGSWSFSGVVVGVLIGSAVGSIVHSVLSEAEVAAWGWRLPFLAGSVIAVCGFMLRRDLATDTPPERSDAEVIPLIEAMRHHGADMIRAIGITAFNAAGFYLIFVYVTTYLSTVVKESPAAAFDINTINMVVVAVLLPLSGMLADRVGVQRLLIISSAAGVVLTVPLFALIDHPDPVLSFLGQLGLILVLAPYIGCFALRMARMFPDALRMSAFSVTYNIGLAAFGGTAPMLASYLIVRKAGDLTPAYLLTGTAVISLVALISARRSPA